MSDNPFIYPAWRWEPGWDAPSVSLGSSTVARVDTSKEQDVTFLPPRPTGFTAKLQDCERDGHVWRTVHRGGHAYDMVACERDGCNEVGWQAP